MEVRTNRKESGKEMTKYEELQKVWKPIYCECGNRVFELIVGAKKQLCKKCREEK